MTEFYAYIDHEGRLLVFRAAGANNLVKRLNDVGTYLGLFMAEDEYEALLTAQELEEESRATQPNH